jgi:hypothetical protein
MLISHQKRFVIFAPWKTASSTVQARLATYDEGGYDRFYHFNPHLLRVIHQHLTCADFSMLPESRLGYLVVSFVRNPYDRAYSGFLQIQRDMVEQPQAPFPSPDVRELVMRQLDANREQLVAANFDFDQWVELLKDYQVYETGHNSSLPLYPAHYWTHLAGKRVADLIGKLENFEEDFAQICSTLHIEQAERTNRNVTDPSTLERSSTAAYRYANRMSSRSIEKINRLFRQDFELFGYEMVHSPRASTPQFSGPDARCKPWPSN